MTPLWTLPNYPLIIIGPHAGLLSSTLRPSRALDIIVVGTTLQGIGFMLAMTIYSAFIYRLMTQKLPAPSSRPGMFVSVGPSGFTATALITMAQSAERALASDYMGDGHLTAMILRVVANWTSLGIWGYVIRFVKSRDADPHKTCPMVFLDLRRSSLLLYWENDLPDDLVLIRLPKYRPDHGDVRYWQSLWLFPHSSDWLCDDLSSHRRLVHGFRMHD